MKETFTEFLHLKVKAMKETTSADSDVSRRTFFFLRRLEQASLDVDVHFFLQAFMLQLKKHRSKTIHTQAEEDAESSAQIDSTFQNALIATSQGMELLLKKDVLAGLRGITDILGQHGLAISSKDSSLFLARITSNNKAICSAVPLDRFIQEEEPSFAATTSDTERGSASISSSCNATGSRSVGSGKRRLLPTDVLSDSDSEFEPEYKPMKLIKKKKMSAPAAPSPAPAPLVAQQLLTIKKSKAVKDLRVNTMYWRNEFKKRLQACVKDSSGDPCTEAIGNTDAASARSLGAYMERYNEIHKVLTKAKYAPCQRNYCLLKMGEHINGETDGMDRDAVKNYCREFKEKHFKDEPMKYANNFLRACDRATVMLDCLGIYSLLIPEIFTFNFLMTATNSDFDQVVKYADKEIGHRFRSIDLGNVEIARADTETEQ
ncbi:unnamed protein product [Mucor circinelloides]